MEIWLDIFLLQCLCIAPTYELALQIGQNVEDMGKCMTDLKIIYAVRGEKCEFLNTIEILDFDFNYPLYKLYFVFSLYRL